jgi:hypothetical protein
MLFNTYGLDQQLTCSQIWWAFGACILWFGSNPDEVHDSNRLRRWRYIALLHIDKVCPTHGQLEINRATNTSILPCRKTSLVCLAVCGRALSCWNMVPWLWFRNDTTSGTTIPSQYIMTDFTPKSWHYHHHSGHIAWRFRNETAQFILYQHERTHLQIKLMST